jgi:hypothetical protein
MSELAEYSTLSSEAKAALTEEQYNAIKQVFELDSEGNPQLKQPITLSEIS